MEKIEKERQTLIQQQDITVVLNRRICLEIAVLVLNIFVIANYFRIYPRYIVINKFLYSHENVFLKKTPQAGSDSSLSVCYKANSLPLRYLCASGGNSNSIPKVYQGYTKGKKNVIKVKMYIKNAAVALIFAKKFVCLEKKV